MKTKILILILFVGLLSACAGQIADAPASQPTDEPVSATQAPANPEPVTDTAIPTEQPTIEAAASPSVSFASDILPLLESRCNNCHGGDRGTEEGLDLTSYANIMAGSDNGPVIIPGDADGSFLVEQIVNKEMPKKGPKLTPPQTQLIIDWVNQGALDN